MTQTSRLDLTNRAEGFRALEQHDFDLAIIGGGITGAGMARDAAMRGLSVALVEAADFASGTSSRSSKLIHGGLRYLAQGDFAVVREAARERTILRQIAPHLARPNPMIVPARSFLSLMILKAGLTVFDWLGQVPKGERHKIWWPKRLRVEEPILDADKLAGAISYPEYLTDDARLTVANIRDAFARGAVVMNYARADKVIVEDGRAVGLEVTGQLPNETYTAKLRAKVIVNAAGPWVDAIRQLEDADAPGLLQITKGIHVVVPREALPLNNTVVVKGADGRNLFAIPRGDVSYYGTTDTFEPSASYWPEVTADDVRYLLEAGHRYFNSRELTEADVTSVWSGVRPLIAEEGKSPSEISRKDEILEGAAGIFSIAGGKLTAYRHMVEEVVDKVQARLGMNPDKAGTETVALPGGEFDDFDGLVMQLKQAGADDAKADKLARAYGDEALAVWHDGGDAAAEVRHAVAAEGAVTLEDWWVRRSARAWFDCDGGLAALQQGADAMAAALGWDEATKQAQLDACLARRDELMSWQSA